MINRERMVEQLILHEGLRLKPYVDTVGKLTIGIGYNLTDRGYGPIERALGRKVSTPLTLTREEAIKICQADLVRIEDAIAWNFPAYARLTEVRQRVLIDMAYNLGYLLLNFRRAAAAVARGDYETAGKELYASKWANQVDDGEGRRFGRADRLVQMLRTGQDYTV